MAIPFDAPLKAHNQIENGVVMYVFKYNGKSFLLPDSTWDLAGLKEDLRLCRKRLSTGDYRNSRMMSHAQLIEHEKWLVKRIAFVEKNHPALKKQNPAVQPFADTADLFSAFAEV
jgi:hypothetical protein